MYYRLEISARPEETDPRGEHLLHQAREFLHVPVEAARTRDVFSLDLDCTRPQAEEILAAFANPVIQSGVVGESDAAGFRFDWLVMVGFRPGVTDNVARSARSATADILGRPLREDEQIFTSVEYLLQGEKLDRDQVSRLARGLLANDLIQTVTVLSQTQCAADGIPPNRPAVKDDTPPRIRTVNLEVPDAELQRISREGVLALSLEEMKAIQAHFRQQAPARRQLGLPECPTDGELEILAQTWSEHCKHKIFAARVTYTDENGKVREIDNCFKTFIRASTQEISKRVDWLVSVFSDNAGVIRFNDQVDLVYKAETHNSPTALDPYGGSMTGIVGVNRDPMGTGMGADLLLNVWGYCFGSPFTAPEEVPAGLFHPRRLRDQVHKGVIDGGNQSGIPYALGWEYYDPRYLGKPLVYCGTVGTLPRLVGGKPSAEKSILPGDRIVMAGGRIGKDGIHGATFSSEELHSGSPSQAVQIGDPITQKMLGDFLREARDLNLYRFITDNGAGGLSSSLGEMASLCGGCDLELGNAPLKYAGLQPWEIFLSEAQERMSLAVPPEKLAAFLELARRRQVEATVLGNFTDSGFLHVTYRGQVLAHLEMGFLHDGLPQLHLAARWAPPRHVEPAIPADLDLGKALVTMLGRLNLCSHEYKGRQYDHEVKGLSVIKPFVGVNRNVLSDATVSMVQPLGRDGVILAAAVAPRYSDIDTYHMMTSVIDTAVRRTLAVGGQLGHIAGLDNFCWPDPVAGPKNPDGEYKMAQLIRANQALYDLTTAYDVPCISGKDSMKNDSTLGGRKISIPPTVLFSTIARMPDISQAVTLDAKRYGDLVYVLGLTRRELGGSEFFALLNATGNHVPKVDPAAALKLYRAVTAATAAGLCHSLHTPALGGLGVAFAKVAVGGNLGLDLDLDKIPAEAGLAPAERLFSESNTRFVATISEEDRARFEALFAGLPCACVGQVTLARKLVFRTHRHIIAQTTVDACRDAYTHTLDNI
ncbi:MAG: AIR synthase-related protein [Lentisphaeria bacterium]